MVPSAEAHCSLWPCKASFRRQFSCRICPSDGAAWVSATRAPSRPHCITTPCESLLSLTPCIVSVCKKENFWYLVIAVARRRPFRNKSPRAGISFHRALYYEGGCGKQEPLKSPNKRLTDRRSPDSALYAFNKPLTPGAILSVVAPPTVSIPCCLKVAPKYSFTGQTLCFSICVCMLAPGRFNNIDGDQQRAFKAALRKAAK